MKISIVVAAALDNAIGRNNDLLWKLPADMRFFKNLTWGMPVIMGRKTFESMRSKPLPGRINIVITKQPSRFEKTPNLIAVASLEEAIREAEKTDSKEVFVIGGGEVYKHTTDLADCIYMTRVKAKFPDADTYFGEIDNSAFSMADSYEHPADEKHSHDFSFERWERIPQERI